MDVDVDCEDEWQIANELGAGCGYSWGGHLSRPTKHNVLSSSVAREQRRDKRVWTPRASAVVPSHRVRLCCALRPELSSVGTCSTS